MMRILLPLGLTLLHFACTLSLQDIAKDDETEQALVRVKRQPRSTFRRHRRDTLMASMHERNVDKSSVGDPDHLDEDKEKAKEGSLEKQQKPVAQEKDEDDTLESRLKEVLAKEKHQNPVALEKDDDVTLESRLKGKEILTKEKHQNPVSQEKDDDVTLESRLKEDLAKEKHQNPVALGKDEDVTLESRLKEVMAKEKRQNPVALEKDDDFTLESRLNEVLAKEDKNGTVLEVEVALLDTVLEIMRLKNKEELELY